MQNRPYAFAWLIFLAFGNIILAAILYALLRIIVVVVAIAGLIGIFFFPAGSVWLNLSAWSGLLSGILVLLLFIPVPRQNA